MGGWASSWAVSYLWLAAPVARGGLLTNQLSEKSGSDARHIVAAGDRRDTEISSRRLCAVDEQTRHAGEFQIDGDGVKRKERGS